MQKNKIYKTVAALSRILICMNNCMTICCLIEKKKKREKFREIIHILERVIFLIEKNH